MFLRRATSVAESTLWCCDAFVFMLQFCTEPVELKLHVKPMVQEGQTASTMKVTMFVEGLERGRASERERERVHGLTVVSVISEVKQIRSI